MAKKTAKKKNIDLKPDKRPFNLILLGDPAAGKATQAEMLARKFNFHIFDIGIEQARLRRRNKKIDNIMKQKTDKGYLTPTWIYRMIQHNAIASAPKGQGILFAGSPRMLGEAKLARRQLQQENRRDPLVLYLTVPVKEIIKRIGVRKGYFGGRIGKRVDDTPEALKNRLAFYSKNVVQVVDFFKTHYKFKKISGLGSEKQVQQRLLKVINSFLKTGNV